MNHKVLGSVFILSITLGLVSVGVRSSHPGPAAPPSANKTPPISLERPLSCFRVFADSVAENHIDYRGSNYKGTVGAAGCRFGAVRSAGSIWYLREFTVEFGTPRIEQGSVSLECSQGTFKRTGFGVGQIDRGEIIEEYLFENSRVEQTFRIPRALSQGSLHLSIPVQSDLPGPVVAHDPNEGFQDFRFKEGGLAFTDVRGDIRLAYHTAVAVDAQGRRAALIPRFEGGSICLDVPGAFMDLAAYPVLIDPWLDFAGSGTDGGISANGSHSESPALAITSIGQPFICWSDDSAATADNPTNTDIYLKWWNGFEFFPLGSSLQPGGLSQTPGKSVNPAISMGIAGSPIVAWEDDSSGAIAILVKKWPLADEPGVGTWTSLAGSGSGQGVSFQFSPAQHPTVTGVWSVIPGVITINPVTGVTTTTPAQIIHSPVVAYDLPFNGATQIVCQLYYPGAPAQTALGLPSVPEGWYSLGPVNGQGVSDIGVVSISNTPSGALSQYPSLSLDGQINFSIAWQDTRNGNYEIYFMQYTSAAAPAIQITPNGANPLTQADIIPGGNFAAIGGSASVGGVSNTATPSQFPSLATDFIGGTTNYTIGWQETEALAPPNPGTSSQIYVARSVNGPPLPGSAGPLRWEASAERSTMPPTPPLTSTASTSGSPGRMTPTADRASTFDGSFSAWAAREPGTRWDSRAPPFPPSMLKPSHRSTG